MSELAMSELAMLCAMEVERAAAPTGVPLVVSGPGFGRARRAAEDLAAQSPGMILNFGTCGALRPEYALGQVFSAQLASLPCLAWPGLPQARLISQDRVAVTKEEKAALARAGGDLVDMEAQAVAEVCAARGIRFAAVKAVSDLADEDLPLDFNRFRRADGGFENWRIALAGLGRMGDLLRLKRQTELAVARLGEVLRNAN
ncbi:MAG: hypothetical protein NW208_08050 [Bryobacter sp.]|nr:hypothetical protein [Bryobacter sp.]